MKLKSIEISLQDWGDNKGKYEAKIEYQDPKGNIKLLLDDEVSGELLKSVGPMLNKFALNGMADLQQAVVNATQNNP